MQYILGIDIGGTKITSAMVDKNNNLSDERTVKTSQTDLLSQLEELIRSYQGFMGIGLGVPGDVDSSGMIEKLSNVKHFPSINLKQHLKQRFGLPISVINDAEAFTLAEARVGAGKGFGKVLGVTLGTGLGAGFVEGERHLDAGIELRRELSDAESEMQSLSQVKHAQEYRELFIKLLSKIAELYHPDIIIFGGTRSQVPGMQEILDECWKTVSNQPQQIRVSTLKSAGVIGAASLLNK